MSKPEVIIVGGGLAGLACAKVLHESDCTFLLVEASDRLGGRAGTDMVDGFQLDRGFQVFLTAYPDAQELLNYDSLNLQSFFHGALVRQDGTFHRLADPLRHPSELASTLMAPVGTVLDRLRMARLRLRLHTESLQDLFNREEITTRAALRQRWGFSEEFTNTFFRPFLGGILLDTNLQASSRMFEFIFRMFSAGHAALPAAGMQAIPDQLAANLPLDSIQLNSRVESVDRKQVRLQNGTSHAAEFGVVVATEAPEANRLLGAVYPREGRGTTNVYFAAPRPPIDEPILMLNGSNHGSINSVTVPSNISRTYAPDGLHLISVSLKGMTDIPDETLQSEIREELSNWFGTVVDTWEHLRTYHIPYALPEQAPPFLSPPERSIERGPGLFLAGDHRRNGSINGALASGRAAAQAILEGEILK